MNLALILLKSHPPATDISRMGIPFPINLWTAGALAIASLTVLEVLFLFARIMESEVSLHNLKVRSHALRYSMLKESAEQMIVEWEYERERTGKSMAAIRTLSGLAPLQPQEVPVLEVSTVVPESTTSAPAETSPAAQLAA